MDKSRRNLIVECLQIIFPNTILRGTTFNKIETETLRQILQDRITEDQDGFSEKFLKKMDSLIISEFPKVFFSQDFTYNDQGVTTWNGDITTLNVDAIVNAANSQLLGCFMKKHMCIDNVIHTKAGPRLRAYCKELMGTKSEETGKSKITPGFCLPSKFILHTVGPIARFKGDEQPDLLASCYKSCLDLCKETGLKSIAFCCISTGVFRYPNLAAAKVAIKTVLLWKEENPDYNIKVIFNTFSSKDETIYRSLIN